MKIPSELVKGPWKKQVSAARDHYWHPNTIQIFSSLREAVGNLIIDHDILGG
jgi:hypothetical protein